MAAPVVIVLFGVACSGACPLSPADLAWLEQETVSTLTERGFVVKPAPEGARRPTGATASPEVLDEAALVSADRVLALDLEPGEKILWLSHFMRGVPGRWSVGRVACAPDATSKRFECPDLTTEVLAGLRPRRAEDIDLVAALRHNARSVEACVRGEDRVPIDDRAFGRVELDLAVEKTGAVRVVAIAPARVARVTLGRCLAEAMQGINVGPFEGATIRVRIPVDLD